MAKPEAEGEDFTPFMKWAEGKRSLLPLLLEHAPVSFGTYHEPCLGGGALFFALRSAGRLEHGARLSDVNVDLICAFTMVRDQHEALIKTLRGLPADEARYQRLVALEPSILEPVGRAARAIYLNRCAFNGLWRENQAGRFNVPWGKYKAPMGPVEELLRQAHRALQGVDLCVQDFVEALERAAPGDLVYLDPPYHQTFTGYARGGFGEAEQERLAFAARRAAERGVLVMVSNSATSLIRGLYRSWRVVEARAPRSISCKASTRQHSKELLLISWR